MYEDEGAEHLRRAAEPTLEVIAWLKTKVRPALEPALEEIEAHLFDPGYTIAQLMKALRQPSKRFMTTFGKAVGLTPWRLIRECRLETAARLLRDTSLPVVEITLLVGYDSEQAFARLFHARSGLRPSDYRVHAREVAAKLPAPPEELFSWWCWEEICDRGLGATKAAELIAAFEIVRAATVRRMKARQARRASSAPGGGDSV